MAELLKMQIFTQKKTLSRKTAYGYAVRGCILLLCFRESESLLL